MTTNARSIRLIIVEDHRLCRESLRMALVEEASFELVAEMVSGLEAIEAIQELKPDIVLIGITMPESDGIQIIPVIKERSPTTKAIILAGGMNEEVVIKGIKAGAKGYLSKNTSIARLVNAIKAVHNGELWVERKLMAKYFNGDITDSSFIARSPQKIAEVLTPREQDVLRILKLGATNKVIAQKLFISEKTVKSHLNSIFKKLKVRRRLEAILYAIKHEF